MTLFVNYTLSKLIKKGSQDKMSQTIAMYFSCFYIFLSSILVYIKLKFGNYANSADDHFLKECGYILLYYALLISAYYQNKKLLKNIFVWVFIIVTVLHFTVTYTVVQDTNNFNSPFEFIGWFVGQEAFGDIVTRTILLLTISK